MDITITATEANRAFSKMLRAVRAGKSYTITSHGEPVAKLVPSNGALDPAERRRREKAHRELMEHLRTRPIINVKFSRDDAYDDAEWDNK